MYLKDFSSKSDSQNVIDEMSKYNLGTISKAKLDIMEQKTLTAITASELYENQFEKLGFVIDEFLPVGLSILSGRPKSGKSWLALQMALSVSLGSEFLDKFKANQGAVVYFALEDHASRLQDRLYKSHGLIIDSSEKQLLNNLDFRLQKKTEHSDAGQNIRQIISDIPNVKLIVVDTYARFTSAQNSVYEKTYDDIAKLQEIALMNKVSILLIMHSRKSSAKNSSGIDSVFGTTGNVAAADAVYALGKDKNDNSFLEINGRDFSSTNYYMELNQDTCRWELTEPEEEIVYPVTYSQQIFNFIDSSDKDLNVAEIAQNTGTVASTTRVILNRLTKNRRIVCCKRGMYRSTKLDIQKKENVNQQQGVVS